MTLSFDLILKNGTAVTPAGIIKTDIAVKDGKIAGIGMFNGAAHTIDCTGLHILPGIIDSQVHFREPGLEHKEDLATGTLAAVMGGVTTIFEMPNTNPLTLAASDLNEKLKRAKGRVWCDYAFFMGGSAANAENLATLEKLPGCCGVKVFMGSSTGALLASEDEVIESIMQNGTRRMALHAEDEKRLKERKEIAEKSGKVTDHTVWRDAQSALLATQRALTIARKTGRKVHILHVTTAEEMALLAQNKDIATVETTPQHLTLFAPDCYERLGTHAQMNPPVREKHHQDALWQAINDGTVDVIGSDHAPHTIEEKQKPYPQSPSGMPGVQTMLPLMLDHMHAGRLTLERLVDLLCHGPQRIYQIAGKGRIAAGYDADFAIVDMNGKTQVTKDWLKSKCGWSPFEGMTLQGAITHTILRGRVVQQNGEIIESPRGQAVLFQDTLPAQNLTAASIKAA